MRMNIEARDMIGYLQEMMDDNKFELDIDALEDAAGGEYVYVDTTTEEYWEEQRRLVEEQRRLWEKQGRC